MNHQKIYESIIEKAKNENKKKLKKTDKNYIYYEKHHIMPRCLNGNNDEENLVLLTAREHFVMHKLLTYIYPENRKIAKAFHLMTFMNKRKYGITSRDYAYALELYRSHGLSEETKQKISIGNKGKRTGKKSSKETKEKLSKVGKGRICSEETKQKMRKPHKKFSKETREKMKISAKNRPPVTEETKNKKRISMLGKNKGEKNGMWGKIVSKETIEKWKHSHKGFKHTEETKQKMRKSHKK